jgi:hypothetical protein
MFEVDGMNLITGGRMIAHRDPVRELLGVGRVWRSPLKSDMGRRGKTMRRREFAPLRQVLEGREGTEGRTMILVRIKQGGGGAASILTGDQSQEEHQTSSVMNTYSQNCSRRGLVEHRDLYGVLVSLTLHIQF